MTDIVEALRNADTSIKMEDDTIQLVNHVAAAEIELLRKERDGLREALHMIVYNTEPDAIKHRNYDHLAKNIHDCASAALKEKK